MRYLGVDKEKIQTEDRRDIWETSSRSYITNDIVTVEDFFLEDDWRYFELDYQY